MPDLDTILGHASPSGQGGAFSVFSTANVDFTIPDRISIAFVSVRSNTAPVTIGLPTIQGSRPMAAVLSCPDGAANNVTISPRGGNTVFGGGSATISGDNLVILIGIPGATDWEGHVGT